MISDSFLGMTLGPKPSDLYPQKMHFAFDEIEASNASELYVDERSYPMRTLVAVADRLFHGALHVCRDGKGR